MSLVALSELLGATVRDATGTVRGRVREIAVAPQDHPTRIAYLIVKTPGGERVLPPNDVKSYGSTVRTATESAQWGAPVPSDGVLLLKRDLLDQQIIDVHGRKVVRVNDVELESTPANGHVLRLTYEEATALNELAAWNVHTDDAGNVTPESQLFDDLVRAILTHPEY